MIFGAALLGPECRHGLSGVARAYRFSIACVVGSRGVRPLESW
ncbi:hypothetical protein MJO63_25910 [Mycobacterium ulcerans]|uniref:Uncharacterized protein n=1 Tax=Mycobacterium ulcerans TaxID=1809 RepID=A0ABY5TSH4_MYCUL|nr:hypothetical protein [Mycobacterium ulcerans]UVY89972.1 hypothetical protein MJO63_25910 [Mycobacterium ulcerans]